jgi:hypothetical protein
MASKLEINFSYEGCPTLWKFSKSRKRIRGVRGAVGSGKSSAMVLEVARMGMEQNPNPFDDIKYTKYAVIRNTYRQLKDTTIPKFFEWFPEKYFGRYKVTDKDYFITAFPNCHIEINFRALDRPQDIANLLSWEITGAWINEAREIQRPVFDMLDTRIGRFPSEKDGGCTYPCIIMDTNAPDETSWWHEFFEEQAPDNAEQFIQPSARSPLAENLKNLRFDYYEEICKGKSDDWLKVYIDNEYGFVKEGEPIYEGKYLDSLHTAKHELTPVRGRDIICSLDFGLTPSAIIQQLTPRGYYNVIEEYVSKDMGIKRFANNILRPAFATKYRDYNIIITGDPAGNNREQTDETTCYEELRIIFPSFTVVPATTNSPVARIGAVEYFLTNNVDLNSPSLQINQSCKILRKGFAGGYVKDKLGNPKKNQWSHIHDALQYGALYLLDGVQRANRIVTPTRRRVIYHAPTKAGL